jgi:hypothetical protein
MACKETGVLHSGHRSGVERLDKATQASTSREGRRFVERRLEYPFCLVISQRPDRSRRRVRSEHQRPLGHLNHEN